jgi:CRP/FNR family cyclic AMP-dependent transcriptional regulator
MLDNKTFDLESFLVTSGPGRKLVYLQAKQSLFCQGNCADSVFYIHHGHAKMTMVSQQGKEATLTILSAGDFIGEESVVGETGLRLTTATALTPCSVLKMERKEMLRAIREEKDFSNLFIQYLLVRIMRTQADLADHLFSNTEKRLARILLLMANFEAATETEKQIPKISQETLAEMIGTSRSRVNIFMNRFRGLGFVEYKDRIVVHKSLASVL